MTYVACRQGSSDLSQLLFIPRPAFVWACTSAMQSNQAQGNGGKACHGTLMRFSTGTFHQAACKIVHPAATPPASFRSLRECHLQLTCHAAIAHLVRLLKIVCSSLAMACRSFKQTCPEESLQSVVTSLRLQGLKSAASFLRV